MTRRILNFALCMAVALSVPVTAEAWRAWNRHEILPVSQGVWEVVNEVGSGAQDYWCAIGDFAIRQLRTQATQRIYIWRGVGPAVNRPGKKSVHFSLTPPPGVDTKPTVSLNVKHVGDNRNAMLARNHCTDRLGDRFFPFN